MPEFLNLNQPDDALQTWLTALDSPPELEIIPTTEAFGRITFHDIQAPHNLPEFPRSTVDGYAVRARDTYGAGSTLPAYLKLIGEVRMGTTSDHKIGVAETTIIHTGGMLPNGADAVVMVEYTQRAGEHEVEILTSVAVGENILKVGEDVHTGELVIPAGTALGPAGIGGLMAIGFVQVPVARQPQVGIISTGDEVIPPERTPSMGQVRDINSYSLSTIVQKAGGIPVLYGIIRDQEQELLSVARRAREECDLVLITAGSSASVRDLTAGVIQQLGSPGVLVHGINIRPGKPTILAICDQVPMIGLPGNPASAFVIANLFVVPMIERLQGMKGSRIKPFIHAKMSINLASQTGREDWIPVRLQQSPDGYLAEPIFGKSNLIFTLAKADAFVRIHPDASGVSAGELVKVELI